jgi:CRP-like cAMP-binding protein
MEEQLGTPAKASPVWGSLRELVSSSKDGDEAIPEVLRRIPIFEGLSKRELASVQRILYQRNYEAEEIVFHQGDPGLGMYIIVHGTVWIRSEPPREPLAELRDGDFFGELALLDELPRSATALAKAPTSLLGFFQPELFGLLDRRPRLGMKIVLRLARIIGRRLRAMDEQTQPFRRKAVASEPEAAKNQETP